MLRFIGLLVVVGLALYAAIDCARAEADEVRGLPKPLWLLVVLVLPVIGAVAWLVVGHPRSTPPRLGPDDDPDFLRGLR